MTQFIQRVDFSGLLTALQGQGYACIGPQVRDGAIVFDTLHSASQLPAGWQDEQQPGRYRLKQLETPFWFHWANGASAIKPYTFAPAESLWTVARNDAGRLHFSASKPKAPKIALLGVRACDLAALYIQDQHFLCSGQPDPYYRARRENLLLIGVNCTHAAATCFCVATGDGPEISSGYDLLLSEIEEGFLLETGSKRGQQIAAALPLGKASPGQRHTARQRMQVARRQQRSLPPRPALYDRLEHPQWEDVGERCLACGNCTSVCPTCFCHQETQQPELDGDNSRHERRWDSCFNPDHGYLHGGAVRRTHADYYRQWLTHKLSGWYEQYGRSGCTGCGRCISWCPAGIDLTAEVAALQASVTTGNGQHGA